MSYPSLTAQQRLIIYQQALLAYQQNQNSGHGLCWELAKRAWSEVEQAGRFVHPIKPHFPELMALPDVPEEIKNSKWTYFWPSHNKQVRIDALEWMINEVQTLVIQESLANTII